MEIKNVFLTLVVTGTILLLGISSIAQGYTYQKGGNADGSYTTATIRVYTPEDYLTSANVYIDNSYFGRSPVGVTIDERKTIGIKDLAGYKECTVIAKPNPFNSEMIFIDLKEGCAAAIENNQFINIHLERPSTPTTTTTLAPSTGYTYQSVRTVKVTPKNIRVNVGTTKFRINKNTGTVTRKTGTAWNYKKTATITGNLISAKLKGTQVTLNKNTGRILYAKKA